MYGFDNSNVFNDELEKLDELKDKLVKLDEEKGESGKSDEF